jgi:hypothetical protein
MLLKIKKEEKKKRKKKRFSLIIILVDFSSGTTRISVLPVPVLNTVPGTVPVPVPPKTKKGGRETN